MEKNFIKSDNTILLPFLKNTINTLLVGVLISFSLFAQTTPASRQVAKPKGTTGCYYGYYEYLPSNYSTASKLPVVIFFHGIGEKGNGTTELSRVLRNGPPMLVQSGKDFPFILISPQHNDGWWNSIGVDLMLQHIKKTYKVDTDRIYITGLSAGGYGTWLAGQSFASQLAGIVPICGCGSSSQAANMKNLPIWAFHNSGDPVVQTSCSTIMVDAVKKAGGSPKLTIYQSNAHDAWTATYKNQAMWDWLLSQRRYGSTPTEPTPAPSPAPAPNQIPVSNAGSDVSITLPTNSVVLKGSASDSDGSISKYSWTKVSGSTATLANASTSSLTVSSLVEGTYTFRLTVTDNASATDYDDVVVKVNPAPVEANSAPILASIGNKSMSGGNSLTIPISATDANGDAIMFTASGIPTFGSFKDNSNGTASFTLTPENSVNGTFNITITATDSKGAKDSESFSITVTSTVSATPGTQPQTIIYRVNAGGDQINATPINWAADKLKSPSPYLLASKYYTEGSCWWPKRTNSTGTPNCVFGSFRTSSAPEGIRYGFPVQNGKYMVNLYFAQKDNSFWAGPQKAGDHVFDVYVEGDLLIDNLDLFVENGYNAIKKSVVVSVADGILHLNLKDVKGYPQINGIEIISVSDDTSVTARVGTPDKGNLMEIGSVLVYPNPIAESNVLTIEFTEPIAGDITYTLMDQIGNSYITKKEHLNSPVLKHSLDISNVRLGSGIYFLRIKNENKKEKVLKIIKR